MNEAPDQTGSEVWQDLVSTALVGTDRRTPPAGGRFSAPGENPASALLSSAALMSAWRRAAAPAPPTPPSWSASRARPRARARP
ncbi:hypothetical protein ACFQ9X_04265 [Catenulispora yoronensis]